MGSITSDLAASATASGQVLWLPHGEGQPRREYSHVEALTAGVACDGCDAAQLLHTASYRQMRDRCCRGPEAVYSRLVLAKTFGEGDFHADLEDIIGQILEDPEDGLEVINPEEFELADTDLQRGFTESIMDRCFQHGEELGERTAFCHGERTVAG